MQRGYGSYKELEMKIYKNAQEKNYTQDPRVAQTVSEIIANVRSGGDKAVAELNAKFGGMADTNFLVPNEIAKKCYDNLEEDLKFAITKAAENIQKFAELQRDSLWPLGETEVVDGVFLGHSVIPVNSCSCYVPGGNHPLFSTALMLVIPAKVAGVKRIIATVPPVAGTSLPHETTLAALWLAGCDEIYAIGGAQAVAAVAYGTETIKPVDMIVGPGNKYVTEAKKQVFGKVGIDFLAGPSEVLVIADESGEAEIIAADLLAQSEHDLDASGILLTTSEKLAKDVEEAVQKALKALPTRDIASVSWQNNGKIFITDSLEEACEMSNEIAPEHLEIQVKNSELEYDLMSRLTNYGSLFVGTGSAEVFGDYVAGTNHTLPTMGVARYTGGLSVMNFLKVCTFQHITRDGSKTLAPLAQKMAEAEGLSAHALAAFKRR